MRRLWTALVHGRDSRQAEDETSGVEVGGDPAPGYRWRTETSYDVLYIYLQRWTRKDEWINCGIKTVKATEDYSTAVPMSKRQLWSAEKTRAETERKNNEWAEQNL